MAVNAIDQHVTDAAALYLGDSVELLKALPSESIHYAIFSPPFASLYTYSNSERDLGNCRSRAEFLAHYAFVARELYRLLKPGRLLSFHCMNLPSTKERDGFIGIRDFRGDLIRAHDRCLKCGKPHQSEMDDSHSCPDYQGLIFHSEVCIFKDPVTAMQRTKAIGLLHKQVTKDSCLSRQGIPDYLVTMRKPGTNAEPVDGMFERYIGADGTGPFAVDAVCPACNGTKTVISTEPDDFGTVYPCACTTTKPATRFSIEVWQRYASPVWMDINPSDTLQRTSAREENDEKHICPLQLQVIERGLELWSNPGDVVLSPFAGIGSEGYVAVKNGRRFIGIELKESYYRQAIANLAMAEQEITSPTLFDALEAAK